MAPASLLYAFKHPRIIAGSDDFIERNGHLHWPEQNWP